MNFPKENTTINDQEINQKLRDRNVADHVQGIGREGLVKRWKTLVEEVEKGYKFCLSEYTNDLFCRELIEYVGLGADPEVTALDQRFRSQMQNTSLRIWRSEYPEAFWIQGYPRLLSEELTKGLKAFYDIPLG